MALKIWWMTTTSKRLWRDHDERRQRVNIGCDRRSLRRKVSQLCGRYAFCSQAVARQRTEDDMPTSNGHTNGEEDGLITFDDTSEFVRNVSLDVLTAQVKRERVATPQAESSTAVHQPVVVKVERAEVPNGDGEDEDMSEDEDEALAEMAAREGLSLEEYRTKIDRQMGEIAEIKAEAVSYSRLARTDKAGSRRRASRGQWHGWRAQPSSHTRHPQKPLYGGPRARADAKAARPLAGRPSSASGGSRTRTNPSTGREQGPSSAGLGSANARTARSP